MRSPTALNSLSPSAGIGYQVAIERVNWTIELYEHEASRSL
jgi:hypothetical protein